MKYKLIIILLVSVCSLSAQVDQIKNDFKLINDTYLSLAKLSMTVTFKVFDNISVAPLETEVGYYKMDNGKINSKSFDIEILYNNSVYIAIDGNSRRIIGDSVFNGANPNLKSMPQQYLDTIFTVYKKVSMAKVGPETNRYDFYFENLDFSKVEVFINTSTKLMTKVTSYYKEPVEVSEGVFKTVRSEIEFTNINTNPTFTNEFDVSRFLNYSSGTYSLKPQYSSYSFINRYGNTNPN